MATVFKKHVDISNDFNQLFDKKTTKEILDYMLEVIMPFQNNLFNDIEVRINQMIENYKMDHVKVSDARKFAFEIHALARTKLNPDTYYLRALGHLVSTIHVKTHALKSLDYLVKLTYFNTKSNDSIVAERLRQMSLLFNQKS